jgi:hypothetical protein
MAEFTYTVAYGKIPELLQKIRSTGVPQKATNQWLQSIGLKSSNDRQLPRILKALGFTDGSNAPSDRWRQYRGSRPKKVLAEGVREAYSSLFELYADACQRSDAELSNFFRSRTTGGDVAVKRTVATFKILCSQAEFDEVVTLDADPAAAAEGPDDERRGNTAARGANSSAPALHIDIQIHISPESSAEQVDQIFESMAKHLYRSTAE